MNILAISTSSNVCSVALMNNETCIKELSIDTQKTHSENLMPLIKDLLDSNNVKIDNIDLIACDNGPGSFTGIRIGLATSKGLAITCNIPIVTVSSLEGLAYNVVNSNYICSIIDARNNQIYCGIFDNNYNLCKDYMADDINNIISVLQEYNIDNFVGDGAVVHKNVFSNITNDNNIHAKNIGIAGYRKYMNGIFDTADTASPLYLKPSQAERLKNT